MQQIFTSSTITGPVVRGTLNVVPHQRYAVQIEIIRGDLDTAPDERVSSITLNGNNFGSCFPGGPVDCSWYDCSISNSGFRFTGTTIQSSNGRIDVRLTYTSGVNYDPGCYCDPINALCQKGNSSTLQNAVLSTAAARVTLIGQGKCKLHYRVRTESTSIL